MPPRRGLAARVAAIPHASATLAGLAAGPRRAEASTAAHGTAFGQPVARKDGAAGGFRLAG
jgi:hypothetical protein